MDTGMKARRIWNACVPVAGTLAEQYLAQRGIRDLDLCQQVGYCPLVWNPLHGRELPAIVFRLTAQHGGWPEREATEAITFSHLRHGPKGVARVPWNADGDVKKHYGPVRGNSVKFYRKLDYQSECWVAEGPETALSAAVLHRAPMAEAVCGSWNFRHWWPPGRRVVLAADHDPPETSKVDELRAVATGLRLMGHEVRIKRPQSLGDYNDVLMRYQ